MHHWQGLQVAWHIGFGEPAKVHCDISPGCHQLLGDPEV
jgi:hypothetical protein